MLTVDYSYYKDTFHGQLSEADFNRLAVYASAYLDDLTMGRISDTLSADIQQKIKMAVCAVADAYKVNERGGDIASETNDGISVTYVGGTGAAGAIAKSAGSRLYEAAALFLSHTGLLYRGVR